MITELEKQPFTRLFSNERIMQFPFSKGLKVMYNV